MTFLYPDAVAAGFSRRSVLRLLALSPMPALASCATGSLPPGATPNADRADEQLSRVVEAYAGLAQREPGLPGLQSLSRLNENLLADFSAPDLSLLASALYLQARQRVRAAKRRPIGETDVRAALSKRIDVARYNRPFFERTLATAKARMARDPGYRQELETVPYSFRINCAIFGVRVPCWILGTVAVILIIIIF